MTTTSTRPAESAPAAGDGAPERAVTGKLRGSLGVASIVFIVVAAASPLGVIGGPVPLGIAFGNGAGFPTTFLVVTAVLLLFAVGFTAATPYVRSAGAFYAYVDKGVGRGAGLGTAFSALLSYLVLEAGVFGLFGPGLDGLLQSFGFPAVPWWAYAAIGFAIVSVLAYFNIELSGRVLAVLLIGEVLIVLALDAAVIFSGGGPEGFSTGFADPAQIVSGAPGFAILFAILSFIGFEATAVFRDEAKNPDRTIPRATYIALISIGVFYAISSWALISANGESTIVEKASETYTTLLADTTVVFLGTAGGHIIQVLFVTSLFACILSFHNISTRYFYSLARRGVLAAPLGTAHAKYGSPSRASIVTAVIVGALVVAAAALQLDPVGQFYTWLGGIASVGFVLLLILTTIAVIGIFRKEQHGVSLWRRVIAPVLALLGLLTFFAVILLNLPVLVGEKSYGPFSIGVLVALGLAFAAGPIVGIFRKKVELE